MNSKWKLVLIRTEKELTIQQRKNLKIHKVEFPSKEQPFGMLTINMNLKGMPSWNCVLPQVLGLELRNREELAEYLEYLLECERLRAGKEPMDDEDYKALLHASRTIVGVIPKVDKCLRALRDKNPKIGRYK